MTRIADIASFLEGFAPPHLAADWDNVGLLLGDAAGKVERVMTCLTITGESAAEALADRAQLIVAHHPLPFRPLRRITTDSVEGRLLWELARGGVAIYSPHTAFDSAARGINQQLGELLELDELAPLAVGGDGLGTGRQGRPRAPATLGQLADRLKQKLQVSGVHLRGAPATPVTRVGIACGSAGDLLGAVQAAGCDCFVTGELRFHDLLALEAAGQTSVLLGHYASERCGVEALASELQRAFPALQVWASRKERDPLLWY
ncbi:MAG: Nif3-like dinuclear metal center hexameric protein [Pirellulales bacterium]|nr:Nif3-like dinuclear metal center hexameric protein [Pirellulales bacterium]